MQFKVGGKPLHMDAGLLLVLTGKQAARRRHLLEQVMPDGSRVSVLPRLMRPAPELPDLGTYKSMGSFQLKSGESISFPSGVDVAAVLGKERMMNLEPSDAEAKGVAEVASVKPEKKPKPAHGGPATFSVGKAHVAAAPAKTAEAPKSETAPAATGSHSISKPGKK